MLKSGAQFKRENNPQIMEIDSDTVRVCGSDGEVRDFSIPWLGGDMNT